MPTVNVRDQRLRKGWTLDDLGVKCAKAGAPTSRSNLLRIERGQVPRPKLRAVLAALLEMDVTDFEEAS